MVLFYVNQLKKFNRSTPASIASMKNGPVLSRLLIYLILVKSKMFLSFDILLPRGSIKPDFFAVITRLAGTHNDYRTSSIYNSLYKAKQ